MTQARAYLRQIMLCLVLGCGVFSSGCVFFSSEPSKLFLHVKAAPMEKNEQRFFYSMNGALKSGHTISAQDKTLYQGHIGFTQVSPDGRYMLFTSKNQLFLADGEQSTLAVITPVHSVWDKPPAPGVRYFRDDTFQWSKDSKQIYLFQDEHDKNNKLPTQTSKKAELWAYRLADKSLNRVCVGVPSAEFFLGSQGRVYFQIYGNMREKDIKEHRLFLCDGEQTSIIAVEQALQDELFSAYSSDDYRKVMLPALGVTHKMDDSDHDHLLIRGHDYVSSSLGHFFKGSYYLTEADRNAESGRVAFLPGNRFFVMTMLFDDQDRSLVLDTLTQTYAMIDGNIRVFVAHDTNQYPKYKWTYMGLQAVPMR